MVIKGHSDFPLSQSDAVSKKLPIGGKQAAQQMSTLQQKLRKMGESTYKRLPFYLAVSK